MTAHANSATILSQPAQMTVPVSLDLPAQNKTKKKTSKKIKKIKTNISIPANISTASSQTTYPVVDTNCHLLCFKQDDVATGRTKKIAEVDNMSLNHKVKGGQYLMFVKVDFPK